MKTVIMVTGKRIRISELFLDIPKLLIPISNGIETKPVLEQKLCSLRNQGFKNVIITVNYMAERIMDYFGDGTKLGTNSEYFIEDMLLGNADALFKLRGKLDFDSLFLNVDAVFEVDFNRKVKYHQKIRGMVTMFTHLNFHPNDSRLM